jgi:hypothetical protein
MEYPRNVYRHLFTRPHIAKNDKLYREFPFDELSLKTLPCFGACPVYELSLFKSGKSEYVGTNYVDRSGKWYGSFPIKDFGKLCFLIEKLGIQELKDNYQVDWTDAASTIITIKTTGGDKKVIEDYGNSGPIELWAIQQIMKSLDLSIEWKQRDT